MTRGVRIAGALLALLTSVAGIRPAAGQEIPVNLAAMTLDSREMPQGFDLLAESYRSANQLANAMSGSIDPNTLISTGLLSQYTSYYVDAIGNTIRTYVFAYSNVDGVQKGFDLLENETSGGSAAQYQDQPPIAGVGELPGEITVGRTVDSSGEVSNSYDATFRIDRFQVGVAMQTYDGTEVKPATVDSLARQFADRVNQVLSGTVPEGVDLQLPSRLAPMGGQVIAEGFETEVEAFPIDDPAIILSGFLSAYYRGATFAPDAFSYLPYIGIGVARFESASAVDQVAQNVDILIPPLPKFEKLEGVQVAGGEAFAAFAWATADPDAQADSVRIMIKSNDLLITVDVQGMASVEDATNAAIGIASLELDCAANGNCNQPVSIPTF